VGAKIIGIYGVPLGVAVGYVGLNFYLKNALAKVPQI